VPDPRVTEHGQAIDALESAVHEIRDHFIKIHDQMHGVTRRCDVLEKQRRPDSSTATAPPPAGGVDEETLDRILQEIAQLRLELDQRLLGLTPNRKQEMAEYAPIAVVKQMAINFQSAVDRIDGQISATTDFLKNLVSRNDLEAVLETLQPQLERAQGETAGGRIRCLLCGKVTATVAGMITESEIAKVLGTPPQSSLVRGSHGDAYVLSYGRDVLHPKKRAARKAVIPAINPPVNLNSL
jgi:uncharacterized coiled-coil protein SlyX